jgi:hypothetical protein
MHLPGIEEVVTDKGYHSGAMLVMLEKDPSPRAPEHSQATVDSRR